MFNLFKPKVHIPQLAKAIVIQSDKLNIKGWTYHSMYLVKDEFTINKDIKINIEAFEKSIDNYGNYSNNFRIIMHIKVRDVEVAVFQLTNVLSKNWSTSWENGVNFDFDKTKKNIIHELTNEWITNINEWSYKICKVYNNQLNIDAKEEHEKYLKESKKIYN